MRVATVDIGTNTVLLLIAQADTDSELRPIVERATITRLGQGVDESRRLASRAVARTIACIEDYGVLVRDSRVDDVAVVGTSALRDARGGAAVRTAVRDAFGVELRVIDGDEEARLTFRGALCGLGNLARCLAVFDIGGGSTEIVLGRVVDSRASVSYARSLDVGSVRLTERHGEDRTAIATAVRAALADLPTIDPTTVPIGVAGTITTLAAVSLELDPYDADRVHGYSMTTATVGTVVDRLASMPLERRRTVPGLDPKRADVIVAGGAIAVGLLERWGCAGIQVSDRGVRWGLAEELVGRH